MGRSSGGMKQGPVDLCRGSLSRHLRNCSVNLEQGGVGKMVTGDNLEGLLGTQKTIYKAIAVAPCGAPGPSYIINKPRAAGSTTLALAWGLREACYSPGTGVLLMCNKDATNAEAWGRIRQMHAHLPEEVKPRTIASSAKEIAMREHSGRFKVETAKGQDPALGFSVDRLIASEFNFWDNAADTWTKLFGTFAKRKHFRGIIESTPGPQGCFGHGMWINALEGHGMFTPLFLRWFDYPEYTKPVPPGVQLTAEEAAYFTKWNLTEKHLGHMMFRRFVIGNFPTDISSPSARFDFLYPPDPYTGWQVEGTPPLDMDGLEWLRGTTAREADSAFACTWNDVRFDPNCRYGIFCDPASYGDGNDPEAYCAWNLTKREEVAAWAGKVGPIRLANGIGELGRKLGNCKVVIESNAAATITALSKDGYPNIYNDGGPTHPGYYRTAQAKQQAEGRLDMEIRSRKFRVRSKPGALQMGAWNGTYKRTMGHHWDRLVTYQMAADMLHRWNIRPPEATTMKPERWQVPDYENPVWRGNED